MAGTIRLQWWTEAITGLRPEEAAASPVMIALQDAAQQTGVSLAPLIAAVEARQAELHETPATGAAAAAFIMAARFLDADGEAIAVAADYAAQAETFAASAPQEARDAYNEFCRQVEKLPERALPAFLPVCLVPLRLKRPDAPQWRRQIALLRAAWFGFPKI
jgi:phytoene/squalene synthetase